MRFSIQSQSGDIKEYQSFLKEPLDFNLYYNANKERKDLGLGHKGDELRGVSFDTIDEFMSFCGRLEKETGHDVTLHTGKKIIAIQDEN